MFLLVDIEIVAALVGTVATAFSGTLARYLRDSITARLARESRDVRVEIDDKTVVVPAGEPIDEAVEEIREVLGGTRGTGAKPGDAGQVAPADVPGEPRAVRGPRESQFDIRVQDLVYGLAMILGILAKAVWDHVNAKHKVGVDLTSLVGALLISPIVYAGVYSTMVKRDEKISLLGLAFAFQNGFFWQAVFSTVQASNSAG